MFIIESYDSKDMNIDRINSHFTASQRILMPNKCGCMKFTLSVCVSYSYLTPVILFRLSGETESNNYLSFTKSLSVMSSPSQRKKPSRFLCYSASSSYLPPAVLLPSQWIFLPKLLYACSLSPFEASTKTNHVSYAHRSNKVNILLNHWFSSASSRCTTVRACMNSAKNFRTCLRTI